MDKRVEKILRVLAKKYPNAKSALKYKSPFQMLISTILSAQTTDVRVNEVTPKLFEKYKTIHQFAEAPVEDIQTQIKSVNFYKNKGRNIKNLSLILIRDFNGQVPDTMEQLISLPGVARKTANVVLGEVFGKREGIVVDTHVKRLSGRLGLTKENTPVKIEADLMKLIPYENWISISMQLILHGRKVCISRKPKCGECILENLCTYPDKILNISK